MATCVLGHPLPCLLATALLASLLQACGPSLATSSLDNELSGIPVPSAGPVLVIAQADVPGHWTAEESYKRLSQLSASLSADGWLVVAPWEYETLKAGAAKWNEYQAKMAKN